MDPSNLPVNWFDFALVIFLLLGVMRGRKHGMSQESLLLVQWIVMFAACWFAYEPLGKFFSEATVFSLLFCNVLMYLAVAVAVRVLFAALKHALGGKLLGSDLFGAGEYYLGMVAGFFRYVFILFFWLALLNAQYFSPEELRAKEKFQVENYGKVYFPGVAALQQQIFVKSFVGRQIKDHLEFLLMKSVAAEAKELHQKEYELPK